MKVLKNHEISEVNGGFFTEVAIMSVSTFAGGCIGTIYGLGAVATAYCEAPVVVQQLTNFAAPILIPGIVLQYTAYGTLGGMIVGGALAAIL